MKFLGNFIFNINSEPYFKPLNNSYENWRNILKTCK
jgi:hypothetical protein